MFDFQYYAPTKVVFGKEAEKQVLEMAASCARAVGQSSILSCKNKGPVFTFERGCLIIQ